MTVDEFLARLTGVRKMEAAKWAAQCPAHDDRQESLVVTDEGAKILAFCHAGCGFGAIVAAAGVEIRDMFLTDGPVERGGVVNIASVRPAQAARTAQASSPTGGTGSKIQMPPEVVVQSWERALSPQLIARLRELKGWSEKTLRAVRAGWDESRVTFPVYAPDALHGGKLVAGAVIALVRYLPGGSPKSMAVGPRELWPAPESLPSGDVWLVEGEPDRVSAVEIGLQAVSLPGIGKWSPSWAARFSRRRVIVCLDCDESCCEVARAGGGKMEGSLLCGACGRQRRTYGGRDHAARVVGELHSAGVEAAAVDLFPARDDGYDLGDALLTATVDGRVDALRRYLMELEDSAWRAAA